MPPSLTDVLCTRCGLCCDGSLFADVELAGRAEATRLEVLGLDIDDDGEGVSLLQPCAALSRRRCGIYVHRPECCRTFECQLLQDVREGAMTVDRALRLIADTHAQLRRLKRLLGPPARDDGRMPLSERCAAALAVAGTADPRKQRRCDRLAAALSDVERSIRRTFLGGAAKDRPAGR
jgi:hypothetical protein